MNTLIINCSDGMSVYILKDDELFLKVDDNQNKHTDELLLVVDELLNQANLKVADLDNLCVCIGPGSFTGIRVAISVVKGLAIGIGAKVFVLSNFDIYDIDNAKDSVCLLEGFSKFIYARTIENGIIKDECIEMQELVNRIKNTDILVYVQNLKLQNLLKNYEIYANIAQNSIISRFLEKINNNQTFDLNKIEPVYLRASQAEIERNKKFEGRK